MFSSAERTLGAAGIWSSIHNAYVVGFDRSSDCDFTDSMVPHPYVGFVHHSIGPCGAVTNGIGIQQREPFPRERDPGFYSVFVLGGSVANQLAFGAWNGENWLAAALNKKFVSPNGKPFRVFSGSVGSWNLPNQLTMLHLYSGSIDAVVALDGYNEAIHARYGDAITQPDEFIYLYLTRSPLLGGLPGLVSLAKWMRKKAHTSALKHSYLFLAGFRAVLNKIDGGDGEFKKRREQVLTDLFRLPETWDKTRRDAWNKERYRVYLRSLAAVAKASGIEYAHFVQPLRLIGKNLTEEEEKFQPMVEAELYRNIFLSASEAERKNGIASFSLENIFSGERGTIYGDDIHCKMDDNGDSRGYRLMAEAMSEKIAAAWKLKRR